MHHLYLRVLQHPTSYCRYVAMHHLNFIYSNTPSWGSVQVSMPTHGHATFPLDHLLSILKHLLLAKPPRLGDQAAVAASGAEAHHDCHLRRP